MKGRPRSVEREVAACLTKLLSDIGRCPEPLVRIPVLGRTGPDITYNSLKLIIDVKSRKAVPACMLAGPGQLIGTFDGLLGFRLDELPNFSEHWILSPAQSSKIVMDWLNNMEEWTRANEPDGISAIVLHRPRMPISHSTVIISSSNRSKLCQRLP